ncbi:MAG TPA: orotate phosphoribosyltransferase [Actinomycetes bacterium]|nr:orotate phosphoribosyltransferase [Actinomycetes bacterium]
MSARGGQVSAPPVVPEGPLDAGAVLELYERTGGLRRGHFVLTSGRHADLYIQSAVVLQWPAVAGALGRALAAPWHGEVDVVVGPAMGGVVIGHEVARALGVRMVFTERSAQGSGGPQRGAPVGRGAMALRRSFEVGAGERALIVENVVTTGGSALEVAELLHGSGAAVAGLATIVDRLPAGATLPLLYRALARVDAAAWVPEECPVCQAGTEPESPGSRGLVDRAK